MQFKVMLINGDKYILSLVMVSVHANYNENTLNRNVRRYVTISLFNKFFLLKNAFLS